MGQRGVIMRQDSYGAVWGHCGAGQLWGSVGSLWGRAVVGQGSYGAVGSLWGRAGVGQCGVVMGQDSYGAVWGRYGAGQLWGSMG